MFKVINKIKSTIKAVDKDLRDFVIVIAALALFFALFQPNAHEVIKDKSNALIDKSQKTKPKDCFHIPRNSSERPVFVNREDEIKATDLVWGEDFTKLPIAAKKLIRKEVPPGIEDYDINVAFFDLNNDGVDEVFVNNRSMGGSGGQGFLILENQKGKWKQIALFTGSFIMINRWVPEGYDGYHIIVYWFRGGAADTDQVVMAYKNHEYKNYSVTPVPLNVLYSNDFQKMILDLNWMCWDTWN